MVYATQFFLGNILLTFIYQQGEQPFSDKHLIQILMLESELAETT